MDHGDWKQIIEDQSDLSGVEAGNYSVDEILSQFWIDYTDTDEENWPADSELSSKIDEMIGITPVEAEFSEVPEDEDVSSAEEKPTDDPIAAETELQPEREEEQTRNEVTEAAASENSKSEEAPAPDTEAEPEETVQEERGRGFWRRRKPMERKRKIWEDFPDTPKQEEAPAADEIDYSSMFRMFAEEPTEKADTGAGTGNEEKPEENPDFRIDLFSDPVPHEETQSAEESTAPQAEKKSPSHEKEPLFAEGADGDLDFRDILREFMLGDQHPIYADMPGIGKKAEPVKETPIVSERPEKQTEKSKREYRVEEDFPLDMESLMQEPGQEKNAASQGSEEPLSPAEQENEAPSGMQEEPVKKERTGAGLLSLLRGLGTKSSTAGKKARNEPKSFASFEDYIPTEAEAEAAASEAAAEAETVNTTPEQESPSTEEPKVEPVSEEPVDEAAQEQADEEILYSGDFPSFGQWILNELMTLWIRLNGIGNRESTSTMEDESEDLGKEVNVANASRYYGSQVTMLRMRFQIGLVLLAIMAYITLGFPVSGMLKTAKFAAAMCLGLQLTIMLLCLDVVTNAAVNLIRRKFGADSLAVLTCVISSLDALAVAVGGFGTPHIPLCLFSSLALMGVLFSDLLTSRALRKSTRVPAIGKRVYCVTAEEGVRGGGDMTLLKSVRPTTGFVRRAEEAPPDETLFARAAAIQLLVAIVLTLLTALVKRAPGDILYILSAILSCAVPATALLAFALPFFIGSQRIFSSGAAVAGWSGIHDIGCSRNLIVTDRDLFPEDTISIETVRVFADDSAERVIGFAGSMIAASGSGLGPCFAELMEKNNCRMRQVEDFQWLSGGGLQGRIEGQTVLCGSSDLMQLMNVKIPYRLVDRTTVLLAIDGVLYGIFKINYTGLPEIRTALQELIASNRHPIFAIRDFNITPEMLHEVFDVATDGYDFPPYGDRFRISEAKPSESSKVSAVICREGLGPLTHLADTGRSMYVAIRLNLLITAAVAVIGMLLVFFRLIGTGMLNTWLPFVLMLLDVIVVSLISLFMRF